MEEFTKYLITAACLQFHVDYVDESTVDLSEVSLFQSEERLLLS
jgi:hypothetical protein